MKTSVLFIVMMMATIGLNGHGGGGIKLSKGTVTNPLIIGNWMPLSGGGVTIYTGG